MSGKFLSNIIQRQIEDTLGEQSTQLRRLADRVQMGSLNVGQAIKQLYEHESLSTDAHGIKQLILDVVDENILENSIFQLNEHDEDRPDFFDFIHTWNTIDGEFDETRVKYGDKSFKIFGTNDDNVVREGYLQQQVNGPFVGGGFYTVSFYTMDNGSENFDFFAEVLCYDESFTLIELVELETPPKLADLDEDALLYSPNTFRRYSDYFQMPEGTYLAVVRFGVRVNPSTTESVEAWFDYVTLNPGVTSLRPSSLVDGILKTRHVSTEGLDAKVIKTGVIEITERLSLETDSGDVKLFRDAAVDGNALAFYSDEAVELMRIGKYGPTADSYGMLVRDVDGDPSIEINSIGELRIKGKGFIGDDIELDGYQNTISLGDHIELIGPSSIINVGDSIEIAGQDSRIRVKDSSGKVQVELGIKEEGGKLTGLRAGGNTMGADGINITQGSIRLGKDQSSNPLFSVDDTGFLWARAGKIAEFLIEDNKLTSGDGSIEIDGENNSIKVKNASGVVQVELAVEEENGRFWGLRAGDNTLGADGIRILSGVIELGKDQSNNPRFSVDNTGFMTARAGKIANFIIEDNKLRTDTDTLELNAITGSITISNNPDYATILQPGGIFGKVPLAQVTEFDPEQGGPDYHINVTEISSGSNVYEEGVDYTYNAITGEIIKHRNSLMPNQVQVAYNIIDGRGKSDEEAPDVTQHLENLTFTPTVRASALITDDSLVDASFAKNLYVGAANIGVAEISSAHIKELHGSKIIADSIHGDRIIAGTIEGDRIRANTITVDQLAFTPVDSDNIISTINASPDGLQISSKYIRIDGQTIFASGYDPSKKEPSVHRGTTAPADTSQLWIDTNLEPPMWKQYDATSKQWVEIGAAEDTHIGDTAPQDTSKLWLDTSEDPAVWKYHDGTQWKKATPTKASEIVYEDGKTLEEATKNYRTAGAPSNNPIPSGIETVANDDGSVDIRLTWGQYNQGELPATMLLLFMKKGTSSNLGAPSISDASVALAVNTNGPSYYVFEGVSPEKYFSFGIVAARNTENGLEIGTIQSPTNWRNRTFGTPSFKGNIGSRPYGHFTDLFYQDKTTIDGGKIETGTVTAAQIAAHAITTTHLDFTPVESDKVIASINASSEGIRILGEFVTVDTDTLIATGVIKTPHLDAEAVTTDKIASKAITAGKIDIQIGSSNTGMSFTSAGIVGKKNGTETFKIDSSGDAKLRGRIEALEGYFASDRIVIDHTGLYAKTAQNIETFRIGVDGQSYFSGKMMLREGVEIINQEGTVVISDSGIEMTSDEGKTSWSTGGLVFEHNNNRSGYVRGIIPGVAKDGDIVPLPFVNEPVIVLTPASTITYSSSAGGVQKVRLEALDVSPQGFTVSAKLVRHDSPGHHEVFPNNTKYSTTTWKPSTGNRVWCGEPNAHYETQSEGSNWSPHRVRSVNEALLFETQPGTTGITIRIREMMHANAYAGGYTATNSITYRVRIREKGTSSWLQTRGPVTRSITVRSGLIGTSFESRHNLRTYVFENLSAATYEIQVQVTGKSISQEGSNSNDSCFLLVEQIQQSKETIINTPDPMLVHYVAFESDGTSSVD